MLEINSYDLYAHGDIKHLDTKMATGSKGNYWPVGILPCLSKIFVRSMQQQISNYLNDRISYAYLSAFRAGYSNQNSVGLLKSYLTSREQQMKIGNTLSVPKPASNYMLYNRLVKFLKVGTKMALFQCLYYNTLATTQ